MRHQGMDCRRKTHLVREKELTQLRDQVMAGRRALPG
jgi:predicted dithiol-disulfide oxidoreductase (DUF899 family)